MRCAATAGQSGAPVYFMDGGRAIVAGVHSKASSQVLNRNVARRVTQAMLNEYLTWFAKHLASIPSS